METTQPAYAALTTPWSFPPGCLDRWLTYDSRDSYYATATTLAISFEGYDDRSWIACNPTGGVVQLFVITGSGILHQTGSFAAWSPAVCPTGHTMAIGFKTGSALAGMCCRSGFSIDNAYCESSLRGETTVTISETYGFVTRSNGRLYTSAALATPVLFSSGRLLHFQYVILWQETDVATLTAWATNAGPGDAHVAGASITSSKGGASPGFTTATASTTGAFSSSSSTASTSSSAGKSSSLGVGAGVGIGIGSIVLLLVVVVAIFFFRKRRREQKAEQQQQQHQQQQQQAGVWERAELDGKRLAGESMWPGQQHGEGAKELGGNPRSELPA